MTLLPLREECRGGRERKGEFVSAVPRIAQSLLLMKNIPGDWGFVCCISYGNLEFSAKEEGVLLYMLILGTGNHALTEESTTILPLLFLRCGAAK
ncbi:hypothetical protein RchiOBHm_Chr7g0189681 [Rosa chinensis]|uniref:Uncharacterized protein n=1 Tax=Rosa chinensis TaxID=74649 RepID=A0A2P6P4T3_ROSCH|nr:hypothetical protein RchiOBHm_Chr7g0189681 [Rosa chinensis]